MVDLFRELHPGAAGHYSYYSRRSGNRPYNRGLRLDYFLVSRPWWEWQGEQRRAQLEAATREVEARAAAT